MSHVGYCCDQEARGRKKRGEAGEGALGRHEMLEYMRHEEQVEVAAIAWEGHGFHVAHPHRFARLVCHCRLGRRRRHTPYMVPASLEDARVVASPATDIQDALW